jgi:hypothetical protein
VNVELYDKFHDLIGAIPNCNSNWLEEIISDNGRIFVFRRTHDASNHCEDE